MPAYRKIHKTLQKLNLSHLADTFRAYGIHDDVILTLTSSQLRNYFPNTEEQFRREFLLLSNSNNGTVFQELGQTERDQANESNAKNHLSELPSQQETPDSKQEVLHQEKSTQTGSDNEMLATQIASKSESGGMSDKTKENLKTAGIIGASVIGASALAVVAAPLAIAAAGFGSVGVVGGSVAAAWQSTMGGYVAASSLFATLQSAGVIGLSSAATAAVGIGGGAVGGATAAGVVALTNKNKKKDQGTQTTDTNNKLNRKLA